MLYVSLVPASVLLLVAHTAAKPHPRPILWAGFFAWGFGAVVFGTCLFAMLQVAGLFALLTVGLVAWFFTRHRVKTFLPYSVTAVLIVYGLTFWYAWQDYEKLARFRDRFPFESMADRVPEPHHDDHAGPLVDPAELRLAQFEDEIRRPVTLRGYALQRIHESTVMTFVNNPGFGFSRMPFPRPSEEWLERHSGPPRSEPPPQPESPGPAWAAGLNGSVSADHRKDFEKMHAGGLIDFVNPGGWGYVRSRREVAGFLPHAFSRVPEAREWKVQTVELVGLLKHPTAVVYQSARLPAMADLATTPTRPPDGFEAAGLEAIRRGDDGYAGRRGDEVRFVGAVRSAAACVECHGGARGDLLGAFSYRLRGSG